MPKYRFATLLASESIDTAATKSIDINLTKPISQIIIETKCTNNGSTPTAHGAKVLSKIELVDGSDVLYSLSGIECQALSFYEEGRLPFQVNEFRNDVQNIQLFNLNFGRYLWDTVLALDPSKFTNLQLKITHDKSLGGSSPDVGTLRVFAQVFHDKAVSPSGFLMSKEHFTYSLTSTANESIDLPTDFPIRKIIIQSLSGGKQPWEQYNKIKLTVDNDADVLINDENTSDLLKVYMPDRRIVESIEGTGSGSALTFYVTGTYDFYGTIGAFATALASVITDQSYGGTVSINSDSGEHFQSVFQGLAPHGAMEIPMGIQNEVADWLDVSAIKSLIMRVTAGSSVGSSSTAEIVIQQLRSY